MESTRLSGKRIAFLAADGVEQVELTEPWNAIRQAGGEPRLISIKANPIQAFKHLEKGESFTVDSCVDDANPSDFDGLVVPGGVANPDLLRMNENAVAFVRSFFEDGKPVGVICHGPWILIEAGAVQGRTLTSWPSLRTDLINAGANWVDEEVVTDRGLTTSRNPADLPAFCAKIVEEFAEGVHPAQAQAFQETAG